VKHLIKLAISVATIIFGLVSSSGESHLQLVRLKIFFSKLKVRAQGASAKINKNLSFSFLVGINKVIVHQKEFSNSREEIKKKREKNNLLIRQSRKS
jgi:hypothetical protein